MAPWLERSGAQDFWGLPRLAGPGEAALLTPWVLLVHGYHPLADDGAVYIAGIKKLLRPGLFPSDSVFVVAPTQFSIFAHVLAAATRWTHLQLPVLLLACQFISIFLFILGCHRVAGLGAAVLAACCFTLPVAGTSLSLMDPYLTARSFSTPFTLFALAAVFEKQWIRAALWIVACALVHPLMAAYALVALVTLALVESRQWAVVAVLAGSGFAGCAIVFWQTRHGTNAAALSRSYFFLSSWQWFEDLGLILPLILLGTFAMRNPQAFAAGPHPVKNERELGLRGAWTSSLAAAACLTGSFALLVSLCFVHRSGSLAIARVQPLRAFQFVYLAGLLLSGAWLSRLSKPVLAGLATAVLLIMFSAQRFTYPASDHVEWPGKTPRNDWQQAFLWVRDHTPQNAIVALDNDYIELKGEDAQGFRATAERSAIADYFKDGGIASNFPQAADLWLRGEQATEHLIEATDAERLLRLKPLGVTWMVLPSTAKTAFFCPYANPAARVCRLGPS